MIALAHLGQRVILRLAQEEGSLRTTQQVDEIETGLRRLAGPDYWVELHSGIPVDDETDLSRRREAIDAALPDELLYCPSCVTSLLLDTTPIGCVARWHCR